MNTTVYIATSLDGFIARKDGGIDWLHAIDNPTHDDFGYNAFMKDIDAVVMGRGTFETVLSFGSWPYRKKVVVLSSTMREVPVHLRDKVLLLSAPPREVLRRLEEMGHTRLYIDGGRTIQGFLREGLIDRMIITRIPVLLGEGIPLFGPLPGDRRWSHVRTDIYPHGLVKSEYQRSD